MRQYKAILQVDEESLVENYLENSGYKREDLPRLESGEIDYLAIVEEEINWLNASSIKICNLEEK